VDIAGISIVAVLIVRNIRQIQHTEKQYGGREENKSIGDPERVYNRMRS